MMSGQRWHVLSFSLAVVLPDILATLLLLALPVEMVDLVDCSLSTVSAEKVTRLDPDPDERDDELESRSCSNGSA